MTRHSRYETYNDGDGYVYNNPYDSGEFSIYDQDSYGPSSGSYYSTPRPSRSSRRPTYDVDGYPMDGGYAGEEDLRRRATRYQLSESGSTNDGSHTFVGYADVGDRNLGFTYGRPSRLSQHTYADDRSSRREARQREREQRAQEQREQEQAELEYQLQRDQERERRRVQRGYDERDGNPYAGHGGRSGRRGAVTASNDEYLAYQQALREEQQARYDSTPSATHGYGRGRFPAYEYR